jgi:hypothetical protein
MSPVDVASHDLGGMHIEISVQESRPPSGVVTVDSGPPCAFAGWLALLHILTVALDPGPRSSGAGRPGAQVPVTVTARAAAARSSRR